MKRIFVCLRNICYSSKNFLTKLGGIFHDIHQLYFTLLLVYLSFLLLFLPECISMIHFNSVYLVLSKIFEWYVFYSIVWIHFVLLHSKLDCFWRKKGNTIWKWFFKSEVALYSAFSPPPTVISTTPTPPKSYLPSNPSRQQTLSPSILSPSRNNPRRHPTSQHPPSFTLPGGNPTENRLRGPADIPGINRAALC